MRNRRGRQAPVVTAVLADESPQELIADCGRLLGGSRPDVPKDGRFEPQTPFGRLIKQIVEEEIAKAKARLR